jgi:hypothetical protein
VLLVNELRSLARSLDEAAFLNQLGPFVLIQRPPEPVLARAALQLGAGRTVTMAKRTSLAHELIAMVTAFDDLLVASLPPLGGVEILAVGRLPDCDLVIDDPSVSKRHAVVRWLAPQQQCSVQDQGSTNGTFVNAQAAGEAEVVLHDGDTVAFGDVSFVYLLANTFRQQLQAAHR